MHLVHNGALIQTMCMQNFIKIHPLHKGTITFQWLSLHRKRQTLAE